MWSGVVLVVWLRLRYGGCLIVKFEDESMFLDLAGGESKNAGQGCSVRFNVGLC